MTDEPTVYVLPINAIEPGDVIVVDFPKAHKVQRAEYDQWVQFLHKTFPQQKHIILAGGANFRAMKPPPPKNAKPRKETIDVGHSSETAAPHSSGPGDDHDAPAHDRIGGTDGG